MIFVTIGSMFPFNRLIRAVDQWILESGYPDALLQIGDGTYTPQYAKWVRTMRPVEFNQAVHACDLVVAHLGMGSIISAMQAQKPMILLPRQLSLGEHNSDHQMHATEWLNDVPGVRIASDETDLWRLLREFTSGDSFGPTAAPSQFASPELIQNVATFIRAPLSSS